MSAAFLLHRATVLSSREHNTTHITQALNASGGGPAGLPPGRLARLSPVFSPIAELIPYEAESIGRELSLMLHYHDVST